MDPRVSQLLSLVKKHPFISSLLLLLFTPPFFPLLRFFSPLLLSTALCALALVSFTAHFAPPSPPPPPAASLSITNKPSSPSPPPLTALPAAVSPPPSITAHDVAHDESLQTVVNVCREEVTWLEWFFHHGHQEPGLKTFGRDHRDGVHGEEETEIDEHDEFHMHFITEESISEGELCRREGDEPGISPSSTPVLSEKEAEGSKAEGPQGGAESCKTEGPEKEAGGSKSEEVEKDEDACPREYAQSKAQHEEETKTSLRFSFFANGILNASASTRETSVAAKSDSVAAKSDDRTEIGADPLASNGSGLA